MVVRLSSVPSSRAKAQSATRPACQSCPDTIRDAEHSARGCYRTHPERSTPGWRPSGRPPPVRRSPSLPEHTFVPCRSPRPLIRPLLHLARRSEPLHRFLTLGTGGVRRLRETRRSIAAIWLRVSQEGPKLNLTADGVADLDRQTMSELAAESETLLAFVQGRDAVDPVERLPARVSLLRIVSDLFMQRPGSLLLPETLVFLMSRGPRFLRRVGGLRNRQRTRTSPGFYPEWSHA
jgi:hypothetical protein